MEQVLKTIKTRKGGTVSLIKPDKGHPFFRYLAGAVATSDSFRYVIRQHGQEDTATVNIQVELPQTDQNDDQKNFNQVLNGFLNCVDAFMDGSPGTMALTNLLGIDEGDVLNDDWLQKVFANFKYVDYAKEGEALDFENHRGHYYYASNGGFWEYEPGGDSAVLHFPSSPEAEENDVQWLINNLKTIPTKTEDGLYHLPVYLDTSLSINGKELLSLRINKMSYYGDTAIPEFVDMEAVAWPYVLKVKLESNEQHEFAIQGSISDGKGCHVDIDTRWLVNQDLREKLDEEHIHLVDGALSLNDIQFTNLGNLWEAAKRNVEDQAELDKFVNIECLLKGKKIGDVRYIIKEEIVELTYLDGTRQNISDIVVEHFKQYFNEPKPDGEPRNNAFDLAAHTSYRAVAKPVLSIADTRKKTSNNLAEAIRRRTIRNGGSIAKTAQALANFFKVEEEKPTDYLPFPGDYPGRMTPIPDLSVVNPEPRPGSIKPGASPKPGTTLITPDDKPTLAPKPGTIKNPRPVATDLDLTPTIKPGPVDIKDAGTIKPAIKPVDKPVKPVAAKPAVKPVKAETLKPKTSVKPEAASTIKPAPAPAKPKITAKPASGATAAPKVAAKEVSPAKPKAVSKPKTVKAPTTTKPATGIDKVDAKPTTIKKTTKPK